MGQYQVTIVYFAPFCPCKSYVIFSVRALVKLLLEPRVRLTDEQSVLACEFSCVSRVQWRQHIHVHRWYSCETLKWSW